MNLACMCAECVFSELVINAYLPVLSPPNACLLSHFTHTSSIHSPSSACYASADHNVTMFSKPFAFPSNGLSNGFAVGITPAEIKHIERIRSMYSGEQWTLPNKQSSSTVVREKHSGHGPKKVHTHIQLQKVSLHANVPNSDGAHWIPNVRTIAQPAKQLILMLCRLCIK